LIDVTDFEEQVIRQSHSTPVLVDFWAAWCGPCRQLGPVLERIAGEEGAGFVLAKVDTDRDPATAGRYAIRSIPAVKLFVDGRVTDEFVGALPETQVRAWLNRALPSESRHVLLEARTLIEAGSDAEAEALLNNVLQAEPGNAEAAITLARLILFRDSERAVRLARDAARLDASNYETAEAISAIAGLRDTDVAQLPDDPAAPPFVHAVQALREGDIDSALAGFVDSVRANRKYRDDAARRACLAIFKLLGKDDPRTRKHQRSLETALF
jgi:putative thioredoxin